MSEAQPASHQAGTASTVLAGLPAERVGSVIGPYKLLQQIGEGGFGLVYMAEQDKPVRRTVALKIIKPGMDSAEVIARFESERQALALMDHPNVAKVLDAGATRSGHPFFVMELVKGVPITEFCDKNRCSPEARLKLFRDVCHAIQHAHQKGIIHRDIKPSNVLVTLHDGEPVVKVIDFGVAKAIAQKLTERTLFTAHGQMIGTPAYMSPEQAEMSGLDIDTRTDVYSLGVLLYELLTGTTPLEAERLREAGYAEMQRMICEQDPPRPSTRLSSLKDSATVLAGNRGLDVKRLVKLLSGDLDWIVMKSLEKERNRRYATPGNFAEDVERYLRHEAIAARPPSSAYRLKKFAQRNRVAVLTSALVAIALVGGSAVAIWQAIRATNAERSALQALTEAEQARAAESTQRQRAMADEQKALAAAAAERKANELARQNEQKAAQQRDLAKARFRMAREAVDQYHTRVSENPELKSKGLEKLRTELLQSAAGFYDKFVQDASADPDVQAERARAFRRLADLCADTGKLSQAEQAYDQSFQIFARLSQEFPQDPRYQQELARTHLQQGELHNLAGRFDSSRRSFHAAISILKPLVNAYPSVSEYQADLAETLDYLGALGGDERETAWKEATALARRLVAAHGTDRRYRLLLANLLANMGFARQQNNDAIAWYEEALPISRGLAEAYPDDLEVREILAQVTNNLGVACQNVGRFERAEAMLQESLAIKRRSAAEHPLVPAQQVGLLISYNNVAVFYRVTKRLPLAEKTIEEGLSLARQLIQAHPNDAETTDYRLRAALLSNSLALIRSQTGRPTEAVAGWNEALTYVKQAGEDLPAYAFDDDRFDKMCQNLTKLLRETHRDDLADATISEEVDYVVQLADKHPETEPAPWITPALKGVAAEIKSAEQGTSLFRQAVGPGERRLARLREKLGPKHPDTLASGRNLAEMYLSAMAYQVWFGRDKEYSEACRRALELASHSEDPMTLERCAKACSFPIDGNAGHLAESLRLARKAAELGKDSGLVRSFQLALGMCAFRNGQFREAEEALGEAMKCGEGNPHVWLTSAFYRAMNAYRQGKSDEARRLATAAASKMTQVRPPPAEKRAGFWHDDVIIWMAYNEAKELLKLQSASPSSG